MSKAGIDDKSSKELLGIIRKRIQKNVSGASWMMDNFSRPRVGSTANEASKNITKVLYRNQMTSKPVHLWKNIDAINNRSERQYTTAKDIMETELYIAKENDIIELAVNMMDWKNTKTIPVENTQNELVGLLTAR